MPKTRTRPGHRMEHLRAWRESLSLSRPAVVKLIANRGLRAQPLDQAALAKWESGETSVRVEDLEILASIYGVTADRLFFAPGDVRTPDMLRRAHEIIVTRDPEAVARWVASGMDLREPAAKNDGHSE